MKIQYKFYGKNANQSKMADYDYIGSVMADDDSTSDYLRNLADSIGGRVYGPLIALPEDNSSVRVLAF